MNLPPGVDLVPVAHSSPLEGTQPERITPWRWASAGHSSSLEGSQPDTVGAAPVAGPVPHSLGDRDRMASVRSRSVCPRATHHLRGLQRVRPHVNEATRGSRQSWLSGASGQSSLYEEWGVFVFRSLKGVSADAVLLERGGCVVRGGGRGRCRWCRPGRRVCPGGSGGRGRNGGPARRGSGVSVGRRRRRSPPRPRGGR